MTLNLDTWQELLKESKNYLGTRYPHTENLRLLRGFISFSWKKIESKKKALHIWLSGLRSDLMATALENVFLDVCHG